jgi:hypothetical protein
MCTRLEKVGSHVGFENSQYHNMVIMLGETIDKMHVTRGGNAHVKYYFLRHFLSVQEIISPTTNTYRYIDVSMSRYIHKETGTSGRRE